VEKIDFSTLTIRSAAEALRGGSYTSVSLVGALLEAVRQRNPALNAYLWIDEEDALAQAAAADAARAAGSNGALLGVPLAIKDNISVAGQPCGCASRILEGYRAPFDATVIGRLRAAGALFVGRTNMDEFAMGSTTENSAYGPTTFNPAKPGYVPGGSSGGSAAAVAGGVAVGALGTDTGGSIRQPAAYCGCVGLRPSYGRISRYGAVACASSLDQIGPLTHDVRDTALLLGIMAGADPRDVISQDQPVPDYVAACDGGIRGMRLGLPREYFSGDVHPEVAARVREYAGLCRGMGAEIVDVSLPHTQCAIATYYIIMTAEISANLARYDGIRYGRRGEGVTTTQDLYGKTRGQFLGREAKRRILMGTYFLSSGNYEAYYMRGLKARTLIRRDFDQVFETCDALLTPVAPRPAFPCGTAEDDPQAFYLDIFTVPAGLAGACAISVPAGATAEGQPIGLQVVAPAFAEERLLRIAAACEAAGRRTEGQS
jgi:aspartyl-tRNA(Asn)/glutamyl-tRNA(Gln) amidotransferase subunit A